MTIYLLRNTPSTRNRVTEEHNKSNNNNKEEENGYDPVVEDLGGGMYMRYGDLVFLRGVDNGFVTNASSFNVLQDQSPRHILLKPADGQPRQQKREQQLDVVVIVVRTTDPQQQRGRAQTVVA